jgi:hypothetical protein
VCCPINKFTKTLEFVEDRIGARGPHKRPLVGIVVSYVVVDLVHQFTHAAEGAAPDRQLCASSSAKRVVGMRAE